MRMPIRIWHLTKRLLCIMALLRIIKNCAQSFRRKGTRVNRHGPTFLALLAVPLAMLDLTRHVLQDGGVWTDSDMYRPGCPHADARCLNALGATCFLATYLGFAALIAGVLWSADVFAKARDGWRRARVAVV